MIQGRPEGNRLRGVMAAVWALSATVVPAAPLDDLQAVRDALRARIETAAKAAAKDEPSVELDVAVDVGPTDRRPVRLLLGRRAGKWSGAAVLDHRGNPVEFGAVDVSGLEWAPPKVSGVVVFEWEDEATSKTQTALGSFETTEEKQTVRQAYSVEGMLKHGERRLIVTFRRILGGDLVLAYKPDGKKWAFERIVSAPGSYVSFGPFEMVAPPIQPAEDGTFRSIIRFTYTGKEEGLGQQYAEKGQPVLTVSGRINEDRLDTTYEYAAPGGKHMFGSGADMCQGYVQTLTVEATYRSKGSRGEWTGTMRGPVLPSPVGLSIVDALIPSGDETASRRAARVYRQILAMDMTLHNETISLQDAVNRAHVPVPQFAAGSADEGDYIAGLLLHANRTQDAGWKGWTNQGMVGPDNPAFGPYYGPVALGKSSTGADVVPAHADGAQEWRFVTGWRFTGPFETVDENAPFVHPEVMPVLSAAWERSRPVMDDATAGDLRIEEDSVGWLPVGDTRPVVTAPDDAKTSSCSMRRFHWYGAADLESAADQTVWVAMYVEGCAWLWVNDQPVWRSGRDFPDYAPARFLVPLRKGVNRLLVRCGTGEASERNSGLISYCQGYAMRKPGKTDFTTFQMHVCVQGGPMEPAGEPRSVAPDADAPVGARRDGSGRFPDAKPPRAWDLKKGVNVAWRTEIPFGGRDVVVRDGRLFVTCEPHKLLCLAAADGKKLWESSSSILDSLDDPKWKEGDKLFDYVCSRRQTERWDGDARQVDGDRQKEIKSRIDEERARWKEFEEFLRRKGVSVRDWTTTAPLVGKDRVWVHFGTGVAACYGIDGKRIWMVQTGAPWTHPQMGSPVMADGKLILQVDLPGKPPTPFGLIALDPESGKKLWECGAPPKVTRSALDRAEGLGNGLAVVRLANGDKRKDVIVTGEGAVVDAGTGALLHRDILCTAFNRQPPYVDGDKVYFMPFSAQEADRLWLDTSGRVGARTVYRVPGRISLGFKRQQLEWGAKQWMGGPLINDGLIYVSKVDDGHVPQHVPCPWHQLSVYEQADGRRIQRLRAAMRDCTDPTIAPTLAGDTVFLTEGGDPMAGFHGTTEYGEIAAVAAGKPALLLAKSRTERTRASPVFEGDRMFLRSYTSVICIRTADDAGRAYENVQMADIILDERIGARPLAPDVKSPVALAEYKPQDGDPVAPLRPKALPPKWLVLGPLLAAKGDPLEKLVGPGAVQPRLALEVKLQEGAASFAALDPKCMPGNAAIDLIAASGKTQSSLLYFYTILDVRQGGTFAFGCRGKNWRAWVGGVEVKDQDVLRLPLGQYALLVRAETGKFPPFVQKIALEPEFSPAVDPGDAVERWRQNVIWYKPYIERIVKNLPPDSGEARRAKSFLDRLTEGK